MQALVPGVAAAIVAMLSAIIRIWIAEAYPNRPACAERDIENRCGADRHIPKLSQCTQHLHGAEIYHNPFRNVKQAFCGNSNGSISGFEFLVSSFGCVVWSASRFAAIWWAIKGIQHLPCAFAAQSAALK